VNTGSLCRRPFGSRSRVSVKVVVAPRPSRNPKDLSQMDPARRVCRWRAPAASGGLGRATSTTCAAFLADRLPIGETERFSIHRKCSKRLRRNGGMPDVTQARRLSVAGWRTGAVNLFDDATGDRRPTCRKGRGRAIWAMSAETIKSPAGESRAGLCAGC